MFKFLKNKLKKAVDKFSTEVEEKAEDVEQPIEEAVEEPVIEEKEEIKEEVPEVKEEPVKEEPSAQDLLEEIEKEPVKEELKVEEVAPEPVPVEEPKVEEAPKEEKKSFIKKIFTKKEEKKDELPEVPTPPKPVEEPQKVEVPVEEKKGLFKKLGKAITTKKISEAQFNELFWDLEVAMLENNTAVNVIEKIKSDLKEELVDKPIPRNKINDTIITTLESSIRGLFSVEPIDLLEKAKEKKPLVIAFLGVNGSGKTTTIAKVTKFFQDNGLSVVLAAGDTFRAAAIDQLQLHADKLQVKLIKHDYGSDAAAVAFDAVKHAEAHKKDVVLIDTAGRLHSNVNLMQEMEKIIRVAKPDLKLFVGESITGNDCVEQATKFDEAVGIDGIVLSKADVDEKGGAAISVTYITKRPIVFLGMGQEYNDLTVFNPEVIIEQLGLAA